MTTTEPPVLDERHRPDREAPRFKRHENLLDGATRVGPTDGLPGNEILDMLSSLPIWSVGGKDLQRRRWRGAQEILELLTRCPGEGWQDRWLASGADQGTDWIAALVADTSATENNKRLRLTSGMCCLLLCRTVLPSYQFLNSYQAQNLFIYTQQVLRPDLFTRMAQHATTTLGVGKRRLSEALATISKIVLHTGRDVDQLTADDLLTYRAWQLQRCGKPRPGLTLAWILLRGITDLGEHATIRDAVRLGQRPTAELVDAYRLRCRPVRDVLVRYLDERRASMDYGTLHGLVGLLVGNFWADIELHHPEIDSLHLPEKVAEAWKQRLRVVQRKGGTTWPRKSYLTVLMKVRAFYLDLQEWALEDPSWAPWAVASPVRRGDTAGLAKAQKQTTARMHQRVRDRLPQLPTLVEAAERHRADQADLLAAATGTAIGQTFEYDRRGFRRVVPKSYHATCYRDQIPPVQVEDLGTGEQIDLTRSEDEAFSAWSIVETLRHTGVRVEELTEITHLALVSYKLPDTGEIVPMLQIVPSKSNEERLLLVSPELASVLATIVTRLRHANGGTVPQTARYDSHERVTGPALPHLFQRRTSSWQWHVISTSTIQTLLNQTLARAGLRDAAGQPLRYTPHDFRRCFATEAVAGGLPVHIVARLLGHKNVTTSQAYMAVFDENLVRTYRTFLDKRRAIRPEAEYREPTEEEWREFQQHFQARKLELGECGRPYGTGCHHEFACIRCPSLRLDPTARPRLVEIIANLKDRIQEARSNGWLGEAQGLQSSLKAATTKLVSLDRIHKRQPTGPVNLGIPVITDSR
jgi:site-specific recombinase XerD